MTKKGSRSGPMLLSVLSPTLPLQQALPALSAAIAGVDAFGDSTPVAEIDALEAAWLVKPALSFNLGAWGAFATDGRFALPCGAPHQLKVVLCGWKSDFTQGSGGKFAQIYGHIRKRTCDARFMDRGTTTPELYARRLCINSLSMSTVNFCRTGARQFELYPLSFRYASLLASSRYSRCVSFACLGRIEVC